MNDALVRELVSLTLRARGLLEGEAHEQLEGVYGWLPDGAFARRGSYPALKAVEEASETRVRLERYAEDEEEAGFKASEARTRLVRETAFTWLNRLVAFKMLEARRLLKTVLEAPEKANAYLYWLADEKDVDARRLHEAGDNPVNAIGEGPRQVAYRRFLLWQCGELAREVSVLFEPETLASRLCPRPRVLQELIGQLNREDLVEVWQPGNEETIGWIYQAFNTEEKDAVFAGFAKGKKITAAQIAAATQVFTPRWVVKYLVENSLGRLWADMHPDTGLRERWDYLVPPGSEPTPREVKPVRDITFLDPACGSMHFGLVAFDVFADMYREELARAGQPGWPARASVGGQEEIPSAIIANNLHGIDIDLRAVQLSAMVLLLKARVLNPRSAFTDHNLVCCNVEAITGGRLQAMIEGAQFDRHLYGRILSSMAQSLKESDNLGSLLRPEVELERLIEKEREAFERDADKLPGFREADLFSLDTREMRERFFDGLAEDISRRLDDFVMRSREVGKDEGHFVGEAAKGLGFLRLVQKRYDVVATNPPYLSRRSQSQAMAEFLDKEYSSSKSDLYAAFIVRCIELADLCGMVAMITQQSFMFIGSFERLRRHTRTSVSIQTMLHLGPRAFAGVVGEKVNTTAFAARREVVRARLDDSVGVYFRLVREPDAQRKRFTFEEALACLNGGKTHPRVFLQRQVDLVAIAGEPWVYWLAENVRRLFTTHERLDQVSFPRAGMHGGDRARFARYWWEVRWADVILDAASATDVVGRSRKWVPYIKGGPRKRWYGNRDWVLRFDSSHQAILAESGNRLPNAQFYFKECISCSKVTSLGVSFRFYPVGHISDAAGTSIFKARYDLIPLLSILNSRFIEYLLGCLSPTVNYEAGHLAAVPIVAPSELASGLGAECIALCMADAQDDEGTYDFVSPPAWPTGQSSVAARQDRLAMLEQRLDKEVDRMYGVLAKDRLAMEEELGEREVLEVEAETEGEKPGTGTDEDVVGEEAAEFTREELATQWITYALGIVLGRFAVGEPHGLGRGNFPAETVAVVKKLVEEDGLLADDPGQPKDLGGRVLAALEVMLGAQDAAEAAHVAGGDGEPVEALRTWLRARLWKEHFKKYRKRPIYWPLQSPRKHYTIWLFQEKLGADTLSHIRMDVVEPRLRLAEREIADLLQRAARDRRAAKDLDQRRYLADDLRAFSANLRAITERGYTPRIDDGILLNAAPLNVLLPSWPETRKAWKELQAGEYDWAHQAMDYWPERVREKCKTNRSYAIAHGFEDGALPVTQARRRKGRGQRSETDG